MRLDGEVSRVLGVWTGDAIVDELSGGYFGASFRKEESNDKNIGDVSTSKRAPTSIARRVIWLIHVLLLGSYMSSGYIVTRSRRRRECPCTIVLQEDLQQYADSGKAGNHGRNEYPRARDGRPSVPLDPLVRLIPTHRREQRSSTV